MIDDPQGVLKVNDKLRLVPGHCDPTCNVHDWYVGVRGGKVEVRLAGFGAWQGLLRQTSAGGFGQPEPPAGIFMRQNTEVALMIGRKADADRS